jgi:hypothetical protein
MSNAMGLNLTGECGKRQRFVIPVLSKSVYTLHSEATSMTIHLPEDVAQAPVPAWKRVLQIMNTVPEAEFERIPADGSAQLDHYVYGTPKRPTR